MAVLEQRANARRIAEIVLTQHPACLVIGASGAVGQRGDTLRAVPVELGAVRSLAVAHTAHRSRRAVALVRVGVEVAYQVLGGAAVRVSEALGVVVSHKADASLSELMPHSDGCVALAQTALAA